MLGGSIDIKSKVHEGTTVEVALPVKRPLPGQTSTQTTPYSDTTAGTGGSSVDKSIYQLQDEWADASVTFWQSEPLLNGKLQKIIESYVQDWYALRCIDQRLVDSSSIVLVDEEDLGPLLDRLTSTPGRRPALVVMCSVLSRHSAALIQSLNVQVGSAVEFVSEPCGPHKLARSMRLALEKQRVSRLQYPQTINRRPSLATMNAAGATSTVQVPESVTEGLADMDLNPPGMTDDAQVVQATETFAASQTSQNAQMALHNPVTALRTPRNHVSEGDSFPFPMHMQGISGMCHESGQGRARNRSVDDEITPMPPPLNHAGSSSTPRPPTSGVDPRVLLVDDNRINLKLLETFLTNKRKYSGIVQAEDGQQALDAVRASPQPFDVIFMDISMPVMDGFEATRAIRQFEDGKGVKPGAMIIALTGLASARDQSEVFNCGCDIYMTKPVSFKEVGKLLDNWEAHRSNKATSGPD